MQRNSGECSRKKCDDTGARPLGSKLTIIVLSDVVLYQYSYLNYFSIFSFFFSNHVENAHLIFIKFVIWIMIWTSIVIVYDCKFDFLFCRLNFLSFCFIFISSLSFHFLSFFLFQRGFKGLRWIWILLFLRDEWSSSFFSCWKVKMWLWCLSSHKTF